MDAKFIPIVERMVKEQGINILIDPVKCKAHLSDYAKSEFKKERHLLMVAIEIGCAKEINIAQDLQTCKKIQVRSLREDRFIDQAMAFEIVDLLAFLLRNDKSKSIVQTAKPAPQSQYNPTQYDESSLQRQTSDPPYQTSQNGDNARSAFSFYRGRYSRCVFWYSRPYKRSV